MVLFESTLSLVVGYLLGSITFTAIFLRVFATKEQREEVTHPSATVDEDGGTPIHGAYTTGRIWGAKVGVLVSALDMLKVALPMWIFKVFVFPGQPFFLLVSIGGLLGHNWPIYFRFKGGRGVAVIFASLFVIDWLGPFIIPILSAILGILVLRNTTIAYFGSTFLLFPWLWVRTYNWYFIGWAVAITIILFIALAPDIRTGRRLRKELSPEEAQERMADLLPGTTGMRNAVDRINALGSWRIPMAIIGVTIIILILWLVSLLPF